jgi:hypothetical protein
LVPVPVLIDPAFSVLPVPDWPTFPSFVTPAFFVEVLPDPDLLVPIFPLPELRFTRLTFFLLTLRPVPLLLFVPMLRVPLLGVPLKLRSFATDCVAGCIVRTANASGTSATQRRT